MKRIFTAGYSGHTPQQLKQAAHELDAIVVDVRLIPRSRIAGWGESELETVFGNDYWRLPEWGNINFKTGQPPQLKDAAYGLRKVLRLSQSRSVILLCGCREYSSCHRQTCAELLHERGIDTQELEWPASPITAGKVRCISLWQPWASLIAVGAKRIETRGWSTPYRGPLLIHAAKTKEGYREIISHAEGEGDDRRIIVREPFRSVLMQSGVTRLADLPLGALVCVADLVRVETTDWLLQLGWVSEQERAFGDYSSRRFGWILENVRPFPVPVPLRGQQGLWDVEIDLEAALRGDV